MTFDALNQVLFDKLNATGAQPGAVAALEALATVPIWALPVLVAAIWLFGDRRGREVAVLAVLCACVAMGAAHFASVLIVHPRPFALGLAPNLLGHAEDSSFPSDHATLFFALAVAFGRHNAPHLPGLALGLAGLGVGVGLARVALGVHFPADIAGAAAIGAGAALVTDLAGRPIARILFAVGEQLRRRVPLLAVRDARELAG